MKKDTNESGGDKNECEEVRGQRAFKIDAYEQVPAH